MKKVILLSGLILFCSCKTREDIAREKMVHQLNNQVKDGQKIQVDSFSRIQDLETKITQLTGQIEEGDHQTKQGMNTEFKLVVERLSLMEEKHKAFESKLKTQGNYIKDVLAALKDLSRKKSRSSKKKKGKGKGKKLTTYSKALINYKAKKFKTARKLFIKALENDKLKSNQKSRTLHNLGLIEFTNKNYQESLIFFGRLFSAYPKSRYNQRGLLYMAKSFINLKNPDQAKETIKNLISLFPKSKQIKEANKLLRTL